ncbi:YMGG-like glycine zipper-containing protein [Chitiniphilus shinanonensis]|uniref:YMGG-like glycine zipper-containing protein n=1 Tax=Chitiniphilus shinanonensis TaxID=553088 RepID=UPI0033402A6B
MKTRHGWLGALAVVGTLVSTVALAAQPAVYPAKGQSASQQSKDDGECYAWAKQNTGVDPAHPPQVVTQPPAPVHHGQRIRGAARGAAAGAVIGEVANDDAGHGAAVGATAGVVAGGVATRQQRRANAANQQAQAQQQAQVSAESLAVYERAYGACMEGRGYTVK